MKQLLLSALLVAALPTFASTTIKGSKSNGSEKVICQTPACCIQHPNANGCTGSLLKSQANLPRHPRDTGAQPATSSTEKPTTIKGGKSNTSDKTRGHEGSVEKIKDTKSNTSDRSAINNSESNTDRETTANKVENVPTPTDPAAKTNSGNAGTASRAGYDLKRNTQEKEMAPTATPAASKNINLNSSRSN